MLALLAWLVVELREGTHLGLSERLLAGFQAVWPLVVVILIAVGRAGQHADECDVCVT